MKIFRCIVAVLCGLAIAYIIMVIIVALGTRYGYSLDSGDGHRKIIPILVVCGFAGTIAWIGIGVLVIGGSNRQRLARRGAIILASLALACIILNRLIHSEDATWLIKSSMLFGIVGGALVSAFILFGRSRPSSPTLIDANDEIGN